MIVQFTDSTETKISSVLCGWQEGWVNLGEIEVSDPRYVEFTKKMFLLTQPTAD
jgi:hypothetical protein